MSLLNCSLLGVHDW